MEYTTYTKISGILVDIDFEKAFDYSLDHTNLLKEFSLCSILSHLLFNGSVLCLQIYQVALLTMILHQIISSQLVEELG